MAYRAVQSKFADLRRTERHDVFLRTTIAHRGKRNLEAHLVNISRLGFMVRTLVAIDLGEEIQIMLPVAGEVAARVAWSMAGRVGAEFDPPISEEDYPKLLAAMKGRSPDREFF